MKLTFFFPYREVSGVPVLFRRMAEHLADRQGFSATLVDYADGAMARSLRPGSKVRVRTFQDGVPLEVDEDALLVLQSVLPYTMRSELRIPPATRMLFWTLYAHNLIQTIIPLPRFRDLQARCGTFHHAVMNTVMRGTRNRLRRMVQTMAGKRSLFFMDGSTLRFTEERLGVRIDDPIFMPVPAAPAGENRRMLDPAPRGRDALSVAWLGRLCDFKIHILVHTLERMATYARSRGIRIDFHVIGDGPETRRLEQLRFLREHVTLRRAGIVTGNALDAYLLRNADVLFAMGTSALEGARLGIPTVLLDASYGRVPKGYRFKWLHQARDYSLGDMIGSEQVGEDRDSLSALLDEALGRYAEVSRAAHAYYSQNHALDAVCTRFLDALPHCGFRYRDFEPRILHKGIVRKSYEVVRERCRQRGGATAGLWPGGCGGGR